MWYASMVQREIDSGKIPSEIKVDMSMAVMLLQNGLLVSMTISAVTQKLFGMDSIKQE